MSLLFPIDRYFRTSLLGLVRLGIFERWAFLCRGPQPPEQETHGTDQDHAFTGVRPLLIILAITPVAAEPGKGALHHPTDGERLESDRTRRPAADLHSPFPLAVLVQPLIVLVIVILVVAENGLESRQGLGLQLPHHFLGPRRIIHAPRGHHHGHEQPQGVHHNVPLAPVNLLRPVIAMFPTHLRGLHRLTIHTGGTGSRFPHAFLTRGLRCALPHLRVQLTHDLPEQAVVPPFGEIIVHGTLG